MRLISASEERVIAANIKTWEGVCRALQVELTAAQQRYVDLLDKYHALKAAGAAVPVAPTKRPADRVLEVIADVAGSNAPLRAMLGRYARQQRAAKVDDDQIIGTLMHWPDADSDDSPTDDMTT